MATSATAIRWETKSVETCGGTIRFEQAGSGPSLLVLPRDNGHPPANDFLDGLTGNFTVSHAWLPGFHGGDPEAWEWLSSVRDLAIVMRRALGELGAAPTAVLGFGFGGWLAAEMLAMGHPQFSKVVLVNPMGIQPRNAYILDQFLISTEAYARAGFASDESFDAIYGAEPEFEREVARSWASEWAEVDGAGDRLGPSRRRARLSLTWADCHLILRGSPGSVIAGPRRSRVRGRPEGAPSAPR